MQPSNEFIVIGGQQVAACLAGQERPIMEAVSRAYVTHETGESSLPHSLFLRFPGDDLNRIIALPAYLGDGFEMAGMKWIASFPGNREMGMERASAVMVVNSTETGRPQALLEGSIISAKRTAASAALAAETLLEGGSPEKVGFIGTGLINRETARFLATVLPEARSFVLHDLHRDAAESFAAKLESLTGGPVTTEIVSSPEAVLESCGLVAFATTAIEPYVADLSMCPPGAVILHTSLRDLKAEAILQADNVVDDVDHVCRAGTSIALAAAETGDRSFIRGTLAGILRGEDAARPGGDRVSVFSPFGLGVLDLAVANLVLSAARERSLGVEVPDFLDTDLDRHRWT